VQQMLSLNNVGLSNKINKARNNAVRIVDIPDAAGNVKWLFEGSDAELNRSRK
jgi:hypothetical protein